MRFERIVIEGFGPIAAYEAALEPHRLNLVIGPNESGKSSLASAVTATLFGFPSHEEETRARPWDGTRHCAALVLDVDGGRYRVRRDFTTHEVEVTRLRGQGMEVEAVVFQGTANPRGRGPDLERYEEVLRSWFGFTDARLFRESCYVHESALKTQISPELRHLISGAVEADYQEIQNALLERLDALTREHPFGARKRTDRSIEKRKAALELLRARYARSEYVLRELKQSSAERSAVEGRIAGFKAEVATKEQLIADLETLVRLRDEQRKLLKRGPAIGEDLVRGRRARNRLEEIDRRITENLAYLANAPEEVESDLVRLGILRSQRNRHQKTLEAERKTFAESRPPSFVLGAVLALLIGGSLGFAGYLGLKTQAGIAAGSVVGIIVALLIARIVAQNAERKRAMADAKMRVAEENVRTLKQETDAIEIRVDRYLQGRSLERVLADVKQLRELDTERREHAAIVQSLPIPERLEAESHEIDEAVNALRAKEKFLVGRTPFLLPFKEDPMKAAEASDRLKREVNGLRTKIEVEQETLDRRMKRPGAADSDAENLEALEEAIATEERAIAEEERQRDALLLAVEVLRESVVDYQKEHVARLARQAGQTLEQLTHGRYTAVSLDQDLTPSVRAAGSKEISVETLSHGTRDAFYFALRAALARELAVREPLPLLLDDPTAHFDEERRGALLALLETLAQDIQVILLTHDRRVLNQVREAHVMAIGSDARTADSARKVQVRP